MATTEIRKDRIDSQNKSLLQELVDGHRALQNGQEPTNTTTTSRNAPKNIVAHQICTLQYKIGQQMDFTEQTVWKKSTVKDVRASNTAGYKALLTKLLERVERRAAELHPHSVRPSTATPEMTVARMTELMQTPGFFKALQQLDPIDRFAAMSEDNVFDSASKDMLRAQLEVADEVLKAIASVFQPAVLRRMATALNTAADSAESGPEQEVTVASSRPVKRARTEEAGSKPVEVRLVVSVDTVGGGAAVRARPSTSQG
ncbi:hypothetical protein B0A48_10061 [Cryoendolithus antarcticus]|uniref:Uncharacterized protein n=1 Tax=Cryoendolithus antarcticus TaxID=1507870 RepID=A0A1V8T3H2_9PEZI|nr:hypothetical protein B0A48_10061 [Cryoendolithus antarcticus]